MTRQKKNDYGIEEDERKVQRRMAEQLAERLGTSPEQIEKGVKVFIEKSSESLGGTEAKPPYRRRIWYDKFFSIIQKRTIDRFSLEFIAHNITQTKSEAYKLRSGLRFLGLIDRKGNPTSKLDSLRVTGEKLKKNLAKVISQAYSDLFKTILVEQARVESVVNFMIERYGYSRVLAEDATSLFAYFCSKATILLSNELANFQTKKRKTKKTTPKRQMRKREEAKTKVEYDESFATLKFDEFSFAVKKDLSSIEFARKQINSLLEYLENKLRKSD